MPSLPSLPDLGSFVPKINENNWPYWAIVSPWIIGPILFAGGMTGIIPPMVIAIIGGSVAAALLVLVLISLISGPKAARSAPAAPTEAVKEVVQEVAAPPADAQATPSAPAPKANRFGFKKKTATT